MFGYLRFILAVFVLLSHVDVRIFNLNPGVIAVVIFYMLAGHVVSHLWNDIIPDGRAKLFRFYWDRILRIMPLYIYVLVITLLFLMFTGYADPRFSFFKLAGNFFVIPLNYYMVMDTTILTKPDWCLIPPAWSLGAELQAYILLPFILMNKKLKILLVLSSFTVYMLANLSIINPDYFGYRLVFGVFLSLLQVLQSRQAISFIHGLYGLQLYALVFSFLMKTFLARVIQKRRLLEFLQEYL